MSEARPRISTTASATTTTPIRRPTRISTVAARIRPISVRAKGTRRAGWGTFATSTATATATITDYRPVSRRDTAAVLLSDWRTPTASHRGRATDGTRAPEASRVDIRTRGTGGLLAPATALTSGTTL